MILVRLRDDHRDPWGGPEKGRVASEPSSLRQVISCRGKMCHPRYADMNWAWKLFKILFVVSALWLFPTGALGGEWELIAEDESRIVFQAPEGIYPGIFRKKRSHYSAAYLGNWQDMSRSHKLQIYMVLLDPGRHFRRMPDLEDSIRDWHFFKDKKLELLQKGSAVNAIGRIKYRRFSTNFLQCFVFFQGWGQSETDWGIGAEGISQNYLTGYYCSAETLTDTELKAVIAGLRVRE